MSAQTIDPEVLKNLTGQVASHAAGAMGVLLAYLGDQLGLYRALADHGPLTSAELAERTDTDERYVREWLNSNACGGYVEYDADAQTFSMTPEQALIFAAEGTPGCMAGFFQSIVSQYLTIDRNEEVFRSGEGIPWGDKHECCFCGTERFFRPLYEASLLTEWLPALTGVTQKLSAGAKVADVGCGRGRSTLIMARAYPASTFHGFDFHPASIEGARQIAKDDGIDNVEFGVAQAKTYEGTGYDLITVFDALHDMGDPVGAARHIRSSLADGGTFMLVEPRAGDRLSDNIGHQGQTMYAFSTLTCTPVSKSQEVALALGAQAGPARLTEVLKEAGFTDVRLACTSAGNIVLEAR